MRGRTARDDGYTLAECLVALFVVGLALGGLSAGVVSIGRQQVRAIHFVGGARQLRAVHEDLDRFFERQGPFLSRDAHPFQGTPSALSFRCRIDYDCRVWLTIAPGGMALNLSDPGGKRVLPLPGVRSAQFVYAGSRTIGSAWPADAETVQPLRSIGLMAQTDAGSIPLANVPIWIEQSPYCDFDAILKDCRH